MNIEEYKKEEIWVNNQSKKKEPIPLMTPRVAAFKMRLVQSKMDEHYKKLNTLEKVRSILIQTVIEKTDVATDKSQLQDEVIYFNEHDPKTGARIPIFIRVDTLVANGVNLDEAIADWRIIPLENTSRDENL